MDNKESEHICNHSSHACILGSPPMAGNALTTSARRSIKKKFGIPKITQGRRLGITQGRALIHQLPRSSLTSWIDHKFYCYFLHVNDKKYHRPCAIHEKSKNHAAYNLLWRRAEGNIDVSTRIPLHVTWQRVHNSLVTYIYRGGIY